MSEPLRKIKKSSKGIDFLSKGVVNIFRLPSVLRYTVMAIWRETESARLKGMKVGVIPERRKLKDCAICPLGYLSPSNDKHESILS